MPDQLPPCPECSSVHTYEMGALLVCPECAHEWSPSADGEATGDARVIRDAVGNVWGRLDGLIARAVVVHEQQDADVHVGRPEHREQHDAAGRVGRR